MGYHLLVITGPPGCGKTSLAQKIIGTFPDFNLFSYDKIKERFFDYYGFNNLREKSHVNVLSIKEFYRQLGERMKKGEDCLIEYPFSKRHEKQLNHITQKYCYIAMTILLDGDKEVLFKRGVLRDDSNKNRHPGHLAKCYHKGKPVLDTDKINKMSLEQFKRNCILKGYNINVGKLVIVDSTNLDDLDYSKIYHIIDGFVKKGV